jgi:hypothetical protein
VGNVIGEQGEEALPVGSIEGCIVVSEQIDAAVLSIHCLLLSV